MWSWTSFILGLFIGTPTALIIFALLKIQEQCHRCLNDATMVKEINGVNYKLCDECARELMRLRIR